MPEETHYLIDTSETANPLFQSGYTYLQAVGSDGSDDTAPGRHLKWDLLRTLGANHLPKGNLASGSPYTTSIGYNRSDDFVRVYRVKHNAGHYHVELNTGVAPNNKSQVNGKWVWTYQLTVETVGTTATVQLIFNNTAAYTTLAATTNPTGNEGTFIAYYPGVMEVKMNDRPFFHCEFTASKKDNNSTFHIRAEALGCPDTEELLTKQLNVRKKFTDPTQTMKFMSENTNSVRFDAKNSQNLKIKLIAYEDYIAGINSLYRNSEGSDGWSRVGEFALTLSDNEMRNRFLESYTDGDDGHWPKFNDTDSNGRFTVNKDNYYDRWRRTGYDFSSTDDDENDQNSLQHFIHTYLLRSTTDTKAVVSFANDNHDEDTVQTVSCLDMLRLVSLDYHVSRILGLGHIDLDTTTDNYQYVYLLQYTTTAALDGTLNTAASRSHLFMTLPTAKTDYRLPKAPQLDDCTFGATIENGTDTPTELTDANGYAPQENLRFININRRPYLHENAVGPFFVQSTEFILADETQPVAYGLEYKEISETSYRVPELSHDSAYLDTDDVPETMPILENGGPRLFTHQEEEEGTHVYAAYAINWFSRVSPLSNTKEVTTDFPTICRMLPPFNYATQLIQDEDPSETVIADKVLVLTTPTEQIMLEAFPDNEDHTLVRNTFEWNHVHNHAHHSADYAEFFFREDEPIVIKGKISGVTQINADQAVVTTTSYTLNSVFPAQSVQPTISAGDSAHFVGALLSCGPSHFVIEEVQTTGNNPTFLVKLLKQTQAMAPVSGNQNQFISMESVELPEVGELFFVIENMADPGSWDLRHGSRIYLQKHYSNASIGLRYSPTLKVDYLIDQVSLNGSGPGATTVITLQEPLKSLTTTGVTVEYNVRKRINDFDSNVITIPGNWTAELTVGKKVRVFGNADNDREYTVSISSTYHSGNNTTTIPVTETIVNPALTDGMLRFTVERPLNALNSIQNTVTISGERYAEIEPAALQYVEESDGSQSRFINGGIACNMMFEPLVDENGNGNGFVQVYADYDMDPHPDSRVDWYKGILRMKDISGVSQIYPVSYIGNLTDNPHPGLCFVIQDPGFLPPVDISGIPGSYTIDLNEELPGNFHPSYRFYLKANNGYNPVTGSAISNGSVQFKEEFILPETYNPASGHKQTLMSVRAYDVANNLHSFLSTPTVVLAQKIVPPVVPAQPLGPLCATRPDVYVKSTYTFNTVIDTTNGRQPYAMVFYRAAHDKILDTLYTKETRATIYDDWAELPESFRYDPGMWNVLVNVIADTTPGNEGLFTPYTTYLGTFQWPLPDNPDYFVPYQSPFAITETNPSGGFYKPFKDTNNFTLASNPTVYGHSTTSVALVKDAIRQAFIPLTEQPPVFAHLTEGRQTSGARSVVRDTNGNLLDPQTNDLYPMVRVFEQDGETNVRFTDYTLDGASTSLYFYCAAELDSKLKLSDQSLLLGPVRMVDAFAPDQPQIRKTVIQLRDDYAELPTAVQFDLNPFIASERISKIAIYRCTDELDALSPRTMKLVNTVPFGSTVSDDFSDIEFPLFGEQLYYRLVAIREIMEPTDVLNTQIVRLVEIPSKPSDVVKTTLADNVNPEAPELTFIFGDNTEEAYEEVVVQWSATCYNGTYSLQKMNSSGNWNEVHKINQAVGVMTYPPLDGSGDPDFVNFDKTVLLSKQDDNDNNIYHRYRVVVENASGLFNLEQREYICQEVIVTGEDNDTIGLEDNSGTIIY